MTKNNDNDSEKSQSSSSSLCQRTPANKSTTDNTSRRLRVKEEKQQYFQTERNHKKY